MFKIRHKKYVDIPDSAEPEVVRPTDWNDNHQITGTITYDEIAGTPPAGAPVTINLREELTTYQLQPGELGYFDFLTTDGLSIDLKCGIPEGLYELSISMDQSVAPTDNTGAVHIKPNGVNQTANIKRIGSYTSSGGGSVGYFNNSALQYFAFDGGRITGLSMLLSNKQKEIFLIGSFVSKETDTVNRLFQTTYVWEDATATWSTLGLLVLGSAHNGRVTIKRKL